MFLHVWENWKQECDEITYRSDEDENENTEQEEKSTTLNFNQVIVHNYMVFLLIVVLGWV